MMHMGVARSAPHENSSLKAELQIMTFTENQEPCKELKILI